MKTSTPPNNGMHNHHVSSGDSANGVACDGVSESNRAYVSRLVLDLKKKKKPPGRNIQQDI
jgi:hypothetical protein